MTQQAQIMIVSRRAKKRIADLEAAGWMIVDVTSKSENETFRRFSPFYPHGGIEVPGMDGLKAMSVEGVWQGLKVFEREGVDLSKFRTKSMTGLKRCASEKRGRVIGHMLDGKLVDYVTARKQIYVPVYEAMLERCLGSELALLRGLLEEKNRLVLLDYEVNCDIEDVSRPLSHASLIMKQLSNTQVL